MIRLLAQADKQIILEYLKRNEIETSFLYANVIGAGIENQEEIRRCADYYGFFKEGVLRGILPFYNLGSCIPHYEDDGAIPLFIELMEKRTFEFLIGMYKINKPLYEGVKDLKEVQSYDESLYLVNRKWIPFTLDEVEFLNANKSCSDEIIDFNAEAREFGFNQALSREDIRKAFAQRGEEEEFIFAKVHDKLVAQACVQTYTPQINQIGAVYTTEEERGKGYGKAIVSELCRRIIAKGKIPTLSVKLKNTPAVRTYTALGFESHDDYLIVRFKV